MVSNELTHSNEQENKTRQSSESVVRAENLRKGGKSGEAEGVIEA